jgi:hypothetical protein
VDVLGEVFLEGVGDHDQPALFEMDAQLIERLGAQNVRAQYVS